MDVAFAFGLSVKLKRVELGMNQEALAFEAGMARSFVSGIERGTVKASIDSVWKLSQALRCRPSDLWLVAERLYFEQEKF